MNLRFRARTANGVWFWPPDGPYFWWPYREAGQLFFSCEHPDAPDLFEIAVLVRGYDRVDWGKDGDVFVNGQLVLPGEIRRIEDPDARRAAWRAFKSADECATLPAQ